MSQMMSARTFSKLMDKWKVNFEAYRGDWEDHNRNHVDSGWGEMNGVMLHHTGSDSQSVMLDVLYNGYSGLPGPLCNVGNSNGGKLWGIGWGRANHAGLGDDEVHRHVIAEDYGKYPGDGDVKEKKIDGNNHYYGMEVMYSGYHPMTNDQYTSMILFAAAICDYHGWTEKSVIGHGEWQPGKWDPGYKSGRMMDMADVRRDVKEAISAGPGNWPKKPEPKPKPKPPVEENDGSENEYVIQDGDTLWSLSEKFLGRGKDWLKLVAANQDVLLSVNPGDKIKIPD